MDLPLYISHTGLALVLGLAILGALCAAIGYVLLYRHWQRRADDSNTPQRMLAGRQAGTAPTPGTPAELLTSLRILQAYLAGNERHDETLARVCTGLERLGAHTQVQALQAAVDAIEFAQAHVIVQKLIEQHSQQA